jgi:prolipoprotein diacylglyceryltransferase
MANIGIVVIFAIFLQLILAVYTAKDARERGDDDTLWFIIVLLFGIFATIIYLLQRNDSRLPESEIPPLKRSGPYKIVLYGGSAILGVFIFGLLLGPMVANSFFGLFSVYDHCDEITTDEYDDIDKPCVISEEKRESLATNYDRTTSIFFYFGLIAPPVSVYTIRRYSLFDSYSWLDFYPH